MAGAAVNGGGTVGEVASAGSSPQLAVHKQHPVRNTVALNRVGMEGINNKLPYKSNTLEYHEFIVLLAVGC